ncbi:MAG TPA: ligase-associated DNA damage response DEXH box helicase [Methyloceanibacter sp.]|nr:ligase-associated DNA damage response DEXH box helicase [Methyloceanibacter sp.]
MRLPEPFAGWFRARGWQPRALQLALLDIVTSGRDTLLIAPTGGGKTLAGFLPSLVDLAARAPKLEPARGIHTLYVSPLKALATDIARNLATPVAEMGLPITLETRTGDTPPARRARQRVLPPDILLTTPEQIALMLSHESAAELFGSVKCVILDELHALATSKRGDLLALDLARLRALSPDLTAIGLSATVAQPSELAAYLVPHQDQTATKLAEIVMAEGGIKADISILKSDAELPWAGHAARYALPEMYAAIKAHRLSLMFVNTRSQAEMLFHELWRCNEDNLAIALHHGSLDVGQRRKVEAAMVAGKLRAVVCTSTLDLGIDWGDVDLVINVGAPKGASRLSQRIGRANHRLDEPSKALLVPANRFEVMECQAALEAAEEGAQDTPPSKPGALDVLAQHILGMACAGPFDPDVLYREVTSASPYQGLTRDGFDQVLAFVATGGYALASYDRYAKLKRTKEGLYRLAHPRLAQQYRLNVGTIVEAPMLRVRLARGKGTLKASSVLAGRVLGEVEEYFIEQLSPGDTFVFAGEVLRFEGLREMDAIVTRAHATDPKVPAYEGGKSPLSTYLADRVRHMLAERDAWPKLPAQVSDWLRLQAEFSYVPAADEMLIETFPRGQRHYLVCYPFEGRLAHQSLGMLLTRRLERAGAAPLGFVANEYALAIWGLNDMSGMVRVGRIDLAQLFDEDMLGDDLDAWLAESSLMKRSFRVCAIISGLIERRHPGREKTGRQMTVSSDLIYDVLRQHEPEHVLLKAAFADAAAGLIDVGRLGQFLKRIGGRIRHSAVSHVSPLAVPVMLEIGRESVPSDVGDTLLRETVEELIAEALGEHAAR